MTLKPLKMKWSDWATITIVLIFYLTLMGLWIYQVVQELRMKNAIIRKLQP